MFFGLKIKRSGIVQTAVRTHNTSKALLLMDALPHVLVVKMKMKRYCALTVHFSLELNSSLSRMSSSRLRSRITVEESSPPKSSSFPVQNAAGHIYHY